MAKDPYDPNENVQRITLDSFNLTPTDINKYGYTVGNWRLPKGFSGVTSIELLYFSMYNTIYNVATNSNQIVVVEPGVPQTVTLTIPVGDYDASSLATAIQTAWNASALTGTLTLTYSSLTGKYTFSSTVAFQLDFQVVTGVFYTKMYQALGFNYNSITTSATSTTSPNTICLGRPTALYLNMQEAAESYTITDNSTTSYIVPIKVPFGNQIVYEGSTGFRQISKFKYKRDIANIQFAMRTDRYSDINFDWTNGQQFRITIEITSHPYQIQS